MPLLSPQRIGVVYAPFQIQFLTPVHREAIKNASPSNFVVGALPVKRIVSRGSPLSFNIRDRMIRSYDWEGIELHTVAVPQVKYPQEQIKILERAVQAPFSFP